MLSKRVSAIWLVLALLSGGLGAETSTSNEGSHTLAKQRDLCDDNSSPTAQGQFKPSNRYQKLIFEDNFDTLDESKWNHDTTLRGGGNWEFQYYTNNRTISYVKNGKLVIKPMLTKRYLGVTDKYFRTKANITIPSSVCTDGVDYGCARASSGDNLLNPIVSAKLNTRGKFSFKYGRVEISARMPRGDWLWPALWMMPEKDVYGIWPRSGEIDIVESRGNGPEYFHNGVNSMGSALHWGNNWDKNRYDLTYNNVTLPQGQDYSDGFHKFTLEWTPEYIRTWADEMLVFSMDFTKVKSMWDFGKLTGENPWASRNTTNAPFDQEFFLIMNLAVGGDKFFADVDPKTGKRDLNKPWHNQSQKAPKEFYDARSRWLPTWKKKGSLVVDYVRVYQ